MPILYRREKCASDLPMFLRAAIRAIQPLKANGLDALSLVAIAFYGLLCLFLAVAGFTDADDHFYLEAADGWIAHAPFVGTTHWHLRHPLVLAIATFFRLFGRSESAMMLPTMLCYFGILFLTFLMVRRVTDGATAALAALLVASTPLFPVYAKVPYPDEMEVFLTLQSLWFFLRGIERGSAAPLVLSGIVIGVAWLLRESCVPLIILYGILFLFGYKIDRYRYFFIGLGFVPIVIAEWLFFFVFADDAFYRFAIDSRALDISSAHVIGHTMHGLRPPFNKEIMKSWLPNSIIDVHWLVNPYIDFFTNGSYGFICFTGTWAAFVICIRQYRGLPSGQFVRLICLWSILCLIVTIYVLNMRPQPRYFGTVTWTCAVMSAMWLRQIMWSRSVFLASALISIIVISDVFLMDLRPDPLYVERVLVAYAEKSEEPIWTENDVAYHSAFLLECAGINSRVHASGPNETPPRGLFFTTRREADVLIANGWREAWHRQPEMAVLARPFETVDIWLPEKLRSVLRRGYPEVVVVRAPAR